MKLTRALPLLVCLLCNPATAVSLGEPTLRTHLGEPLLVEFQLSDLEGLDPSQLRVSLAPAEAYRKQGLDAPASPALQFEVEMKGDRGMARLLSRDPVVEPYLHLIVQVSWPQGNLQRVVKLLLNPAP